MTRVYPILGSVMLGGVTVALDTDIGQQFIIDCARNIEGQIPDREIKNKYELSDRDWERLAENVPLLQAVQVERKRRILSGEAAKRKPRSIYLCESANRPQWNYGRWTGLTTAPDRGCTGTTPSCDHWSGNFGRAQGKGHHPHRLWRGLQNSPGNYASCTTADRRRRSPVTNPFQSIIGEQPPPANPSGCTYDGDERNSIAEMPAEDTRAEKAAATSVPARRQARPASNLPAPSA